MLACDTFGKMMENGVWPRYCHPHQPVIYYLCLKQVDLSAAFKACSTAPSERRRRTQPVSPIDNTMRSKIMAASELSTHLPMDPGTHLQPRDPLAMRVVVAPSSCEAVKTTATWMRVSV